MISNPNESSVRPATCRPSGTDGDDGFETGIALPSGQHANQRPEHRSAPKVRKNLNIDPRSASNFGYDSISVQAS